MLNSTQDGAFLAQQHRPLTFQQPRRLLDHLDRRTFAEAGFAQARERVARRSNNLISTRSRRALPSPSQKRHRHPAGSIPCRFLEDTARDDHFRIDLEEAVQRVPAAGVMSRPGIDDKQLQPACDGFGENQERARAVRASRPCVGSWGNGRPASTSHISP